MVAATVVVECAAPDDAVHGVTVGEGVREGLEDDGAAALAAYEAVGAGVEGVGDTVR
ncbi:hypothetical protein ACFQ10_05400 [Streptomyces indonesiensis]